MARGAIDDKAGDVVVDGEDPFSDVEAAFVGRQSIRVRRCDGNEDLIRRRRPPPPERGLDVASCMSITPPESSDNEVGVGLLLGSLALTVSSLSCPLSPPGSSPCSQTRGTKSGPTRKSDFFQTVSELITLPLNNHIRRERINGAPLESIDVHHRYLNTNNSSSTQTDKVNIQSSANQQADRPKTQEVTKSARHPMHVHPNR